jgi:NAD+ synthase
MVDIKQLSRSVHLTDVEQVAATLAEDIKRAARRFRRTKAVVALSGGVDSSVAVGLAARALGPRRVRALALPDQDSSPASAEIAADVAKTFGVELMKRDITGVLDALGCYADRLAVVRRIQPAFDPARGDAFSVEFVPATGQDDRLQSFVLRIVRNGEPTQHRLGGRDFLTIMAATNEKQRVRMLLTYRAADEYNMLVVGTSNRLELDQGFFVKHGDGCGDVFPLRYLLKSQVYDLAAHLGVPVSVTARPPTTDTFSAPQSQEEYFYGTSVELGDELWLAWSKAESPTAVAARLSISIANVEKFFDLYTRRAAYAEYLSETL